MLKRKADYNKKKSKRINICKKQKYTDLMLSLLKIPDDLICKIMSFIGVPADIIVYVLLMFKLSNVTKKNINSSHINFIKNVVNTLNIEQDFDIKLIKNNPCSLNTINNIINGVYFNHGNFIALYGDIEEIKKKLFYESPSIAIINIHNLYRIGYTLYLNPTKMDLNVHKHKFDEQQIFHRLFEIENKSSENDNFLNLQIQDIHKNILTSSLKLLSILNFNCGSVIYLLYDIFKHKQDRIIHSLFSLTSQIFITIDMANSDSIVLYLDFRIKEQIKQISFINSDNKNNNNNITFLIENKTTMVFSHLDFLIKLDEDFEGQITIIIIFGKTYKSSLWELFLNINKLKKTYKKLNIKLICVRMNIYIDTFLYFIDKINTHNISISFIRCTFNNFSLMEFYNTMDDYLNTISLRNKFNVIKCDIYRLGESIKFDNNEQSEKYFLFENFNLSLIPEKK